MEAYALLFETEDVATLRKGRLENGILDFGDRAFNVSKAKAKMLKKSFGYYPLYILRWDSVEPAENLNPKFTPDEDVDPDNLKRLISLRILGNLIGLKKRTVGAIPLILIGLFFGMMIGYAIFMLMRR
ncbi:MAG: hypothetical protein QXF61_04355 [Nitrososphaeria archaeon]